MPKCFDGQGGIGHDLCTFEAEFRAARAGSSNELGLLLERCRDYLLLIANAEVPSDVRPKVGASDLVQQSLAEACHVFAQFQGHTESELRGWLRCILLNNLRDANRAFVGVAKRDATREVRLDADSSEAGGYNSLISADPSPSACAVAAEEFTLLHAALARLPARYAQVIQLRNLEYRSFAEIGERMQMPQASARKLWERAVKRLTRELRSGDVEH